MAAPGSMPLCVTTYTATYDNTRLNLVKSANRYRRHLTERHTTRAFNGIKATKGLFIMCPSTNMIGIKDKLILRANDSGIYFGYNRQQNLILWDCAPLWCGKERTRIGLSVY